MIIINKDNMPKPFKLDEYKDFRIHRLVEETGRRGSGKNNCSGYNLWKRSWDNMSVAEYQQMIEDTCDKNDPQTDKSKHLKYDIGKGWVELVPPKQGINSDIDRNWSTEELESAVSAYIDMRQKEADGKPYTKKSYYIELSEKFGRTEKSYEYRMQNISYIYSLLGRDWIKGLRPAKNVGAKVAGELEALINTAEGQASLPTAEFQSTVNTLKQKNNTTPPNGNKNPNKKSTEVTQYNRDPEVVAWVLNEANGTCESCNNSAPFTKEDGTSFLEVHHLRRLADGGSDTITNAVAACPNCHRELHYGANRILLLQSIYSKVGRLIVE